MSPLDKNLAAPAAAPSLADMEADAVRAAQAIVTLLPATSDLSAGVPQPPALVDASAWAGAAVAPLAGSKDGMVGVLVGAELVAALAESPMGPLELGAAVQPSLDAAAAALGTTAGAGRSIDASELDAVIKDSTVAVPLVAGGTTAAVLLVAAPGRQEVSAPAAAAVSGAAPRPGIELLHGVAMDVTVELGRTRLSVRELLALTPGDVLELDRVAGSPADLLVNGRLIARGEVVVVDENFALRVTEIVAHSAAS
ncbi:MAG TPA: flagellar motor switch protein FliN [Nocardioidaceae bacterium]|nr:flagellar motor switch protein FliN [Nocardioidaceae bacterium]